VAFFRPAPTAPNHTEPESPSWDSAAELAAAPATVRPSTRREETNTPKPDGFLDIEGTVVVPRWSELQEATISLIPQPGNPAAKRETYLGNRPNFRFEKVAEGNWILEATAKNCHKYRGFYTFLDDGTRYHILAPLELDRLIRGKVVDESGLPLEGLKVAAIRIVDDLTLAVTPRTATCDRDGNFAIRNLRPGPYRVIPGGNRYPAGKEKQIQLAGNEAYVEFILPNAGSAKVQVVSKAANEPLSGVTVTARRVSAPTPESQAPPGHASSARTDETGTALLPYLPPGEYSFSAFGGKWRRRIERASVRSGIQTQLVIQVGNIKANPRQ
jgi:hypothetical protein